LSYIEICIELSDNYIVTAESCVDKDIYYVTSLLCSTIGLHIAKSGFADVVNELTLQQESSKTRVSTSQALNTSLVSRRQCRLSTTIVQTYVH